MLLVLPLFSLKLSLAAAWCCTEPHISLCASSPARAHAGTRFPPHHDGYTGGAPPGLHQKTLKEDLKIGRSACAMHGDTLKRLKPELQ